ncbi:uncharacterized protein BX664DRAFT_322145 [Halteromyces radiatus]|uniref:uncharacterized protein n=1 Tax=Halteromyces radiatus TaxID=101107 RepID=UPI00221EB905|nr:uncharacterized protein BX664DRAFT_322145 [Halteromyces radiatus]KAI8099801.1 hypothetical protein BX664DRAFT_322145 [Halteromyces radiatus]
MNYDNIMKKDLLRTKCDDVLGSMQSRVPFAFKGYPSYATFQPPPISSDMDGSSGDTPTFDKRNWVPVPSSNKLDRQALKTKHHFVADPEWLPPVQTPQHRVPRPRSRGVKLRSVEAIVNDNQRQRALSSEERTAYMTARTPPQQQPPAQRPPPPPPKSKMLDILNEIKAVSRPSSSSSPSSVKSSLTPTATASQNGTKKTPQPSTPNKKMESHQVFKKPGHPSTATPPPPTAVASNVVTASSTPRSTSRQSAGEKQLSTKSAKSKSNDTTLDLFLTKQYLLNDMEDPAATRHIEDLARLNVIKKRPILRVRILLKKSDPSNDIKSKDNSKKSKNDTQPTQITQNDTATFNLPTGTIPTEFIRSIKIRKKVKSDQVTPVTTTMPKSTKSHIIELEEGETISPSPSPRRPSSTSPERATAKLANKRQREDRDHTTTTTTTTDSQSRRSKISRKETSSSLSSKHNSNEDDRQHDSNIGSRSTTRKDKHHSNDDDRRSSSSSSKRQERSGDDSSDKRRSRRESSSKYSRDDEYTSSSSSKYRSSQRSSSSRRHRSSRSRSRSRSPLRRSSSSSSNTQSSSSLERSRRHTSNTTTTSSTTSTKESHRSSKEKPTSSHTSDSTSALKEMPMKNTIASIPSSTSSSSSSPAMITKDLTKGNSYNATTPIVSPAAVTTVKQMTPKTAIVENQKQYHPATAENAETPDQYRIFSMMFQKLALAYKRRGDHAKTEIAGVLDHMQAFLNYVMGFHYQDKLSNDLGQKSWDTLHPFIDVVLKKLRARKDKVKQDAELYGLCLRMKALVLFYTFSRREMNARIKVTRLGEKSTDMDDTRRMEYSKSVDKVLQDHEMAYAALRESDKYIAFDHIQSQFPVSYQNVCVLGQLGPGIVLGGEAGTSVGPMFPLVPYARLHHAAIMAKCMLQEYVEKEQLDYHTITETEDYM